MSQRLIRSIRASSILLVSLVCTASGQVNRTERPKTQAVRAAECLSCLHAIRPVLFALNAGSSAIEKFAADSGIIVPPLQDIPTFANAGPAVAAAGVVLPGVQVPPAGGATIPPWLRAPAPPGFYYIEPPRMAVENSDWAEALRLHIALNQSSVDPQARNSVELPWLWLSSKQQELYSEGEAIDADWATAFPGVQSAVNAYVDGYWDLKKAVERWEADSKQYDVNCHRSVPPEEMERTTRDCFSTYSALNARLEEIRQREVDLNSALARSVTQPTASHYSKIQSYIQKVEHWNTKVIEYNKAASQLLSSVRKPDIRFIDRLVKDYGLDKCQRRVLHDEITGQNLSDQEIEDIARELGHTGRGRCRRQGGGA